MIEQRRRSSLLLQDLVLGGVLLAIGILFPIAFHALDIAGSTFLPMHIPILIGGFFLPWQEALLLGLLTSFLSFLFTSLPPFPIFLVMMGELGTYGLLISLLSRKLRMGIYPTLVLGMLAGRAVYIFLFWLVLIVFSGKPFDFLEVLSALFVAALPGIIIQLFLVPVLVKVLRKEERWF